jgi:hypothetical protein
MIFTSSTEPPDRFTGGEIYIYVDDITGWGLK